MKNRFAVSPELKVEEELRRRLSKLLLKAALLGKREIIARIEKHCRQQIVDLLESSPVFFEDRVGPKKVRIRSRYLPYFEDANLFKYPMRWIENLPIFETLKSTNGTIRDLLNCPYDQTKFRELVVKNGKKTEKLIIKRINRDRTEAKRTKLAAKKGIPTVTVVGTVRDRGNAYLIMKQEKARDLHDLEKKGYGVEVIENCLISSYQPLNEEEAMLQTALLRDWDWQQDFEEGVLSNWKSLIQEFQIGAIQGLDWQSWQGKLKEVLERLHYFKAQIPGFPQCEIVLPEEIDELWLILNFKKMSDCLVDWQVKSEFEKRKRKLIYGGELLPRITKLAEKIENAGMTHPDFELRNILMKWDDKRQQPLKVKGKVALVVIDWENFTEDSY